MKPASYPHRKHLSAALDARYRAPLIAFFQRRTGSRGEAEQLTQEVFLRLLQRVGADEAEIAEGLIFSIATNLMRDQPRRARSRSVGFHNKVEEGDRLAQNDAIVERPTARREMLSPVLAALDGVGPRARSIFLLYRLEGLKQPEIAHLFDIPVSAVEQDIIKVLKRVAVALS